MCQNRCCLSRVSLSEASAPSEGFFAVVAASFIIDSSLRSRSHAVSSRTPRFEPAASSKCASLCAQQHLNNGVVEVGASERAVAALGEHRAHERRLLGRA